MSAPTGTAIEIRTTDLAPMQKKVHVPIDVKLEFDVVPGHVRITSRDGRVGVLAPAALLEKKFVAGLVPSVAYFRAQLGGAGGALEIIERYFPLKVKQW